MYSGCVKIIILNVVGNIINIKSCKLLLIKCVNLWWFFKVIVFVINGNLVVEIEVVKVMIIMVNLFGLVLKILKSFCNWVFE